jgi:two-component system, NarL family, invasion response regulator UvrY
MTMRILIADDHAVVRQGLRQILADDFTSMQVGEAQNARETLAQVEKSAWDLLVLDINMPDRSGLEILEELKQLRPQLPILYLSVNSEDQYAVRCLRAGASGYLAKELVSAVKKVLSGGKYISPGLAEKLAVGLQAPEKPLHEQLSNREFQVLRLIASGKTPTEIAEMLSLSVPTISTYRARILEKMKMKTSAELMRYALQHGLV